MSIVNEIEDAKMNCEPVHHSSAIDNIALRGSDFIICYS